MTQHVYRFTPSKKIDEKSYRCANVEVFNLDGKSIGSYAWSRRRPSEPDIQRMVTELIREYETHKIWNRKAVA
jgi:hypothetical protein